MKQQFTILGNIIRELRKSKGLEQKDLAHRLNVSSGLMNHYETGLRRPSLEFAFRLEHELKLGDAPLSGRMIGEDYLAATGKQPAAQLFLKHGGGTEQVAAMSVQSGKLIEIGEIAGKKVRLRLDLE